MVSGEARSVTLGYSWNQGCTVWCSVVYRVLRNVVPSILSHHPGSLTWDMVILWAPLEGQLPCCFQNHFFPHEKPLLPHHIGRLVDFLPFGWARHTLICLNISKASTKNLTYPYTYTVRAQKTQYYPLIVLMFMIGPLWICSRRKHWERANCGKGLPAKAIPHWCLSFCGIISGCSTSSLLWKPRTRKGAFRESLSSWDQMQAGL